MLFIRLSKTHPRDLEVDLKVIGLRVEIAFQNAEFEYNIDI